MDGSNEKECCTLCDGFGIISLELDYYVWGNDIICPCSEKEALENKELE